MRLLPIALFYRGVIMKVKFRVSALVFGVVAAALAVCVQIFAGFHPPQAYGLCIVCHTRDMINALFSRLSWYGAPTSTIALRGLMLTPVGLLVGAAFMAILRGEWKFRISENVILAPILGFITMTAGLVISGCPIRLLLRSAYGDIGAIASIFTLVLGIFLATLILKRRARAK